MNTFFFQDFAVNNEGDDSDRTGLCEILGIHNRGNS
jgi:hypothetical protein